MVSFTVRTVPARARPIVGQVTRRVRSGGPVRGRAIGAAGVVDFLHQARPLQVWLDTHVGDSELEGAWGR